MQIPILIEPLPDGRGFRAKTGDPLGLAAEGPTKAEAVRQLKELANGRLAGGAEVVSMELAAGTPWADFAGFLPDDELTRQWMDALQENRRKANADADGLLAVNVGS